jgi:putative hydrolase of HD superfamily
MEHQTSLNKLLSFVALMNAANKTERVGYVPGLNRSVNVIEHSYQLALLAWYLISSNDLPLNKELAIKYAIAHDLIEAYAGDTYMYDEAAINTKQEREEKARERIKKEFPEFSDIYSYISNYERRGDPESTFIYALDKLIDDLNVYLDHGRLWKERKETLEKMLAARTGKAAASPYIAPYLEAFIREIREYETEYFL